VGCIRWPYVILNYSSTQELSQQQEVFYVTERAVFKLTELGVKLREIAQGVDMQKNILEQMDFTPLMPQPLEVMDSHIFLDAGHG
jgi:acyl CoA:acetate/3-ketoacid CoA transferase